MKTSLRILVVAASLAVAAPLYAQGGGGGGGGGMQMTPEQRMAAQKTRMFEGITLSATQSAKIDTIMMATSKKQAEARAAGTDMRSPEGQAKMKEIRDGQTADIKKVLTADQIPTFDKNMEGMAGRGRGGF